MSSPYESLCRFFLLAGAFAWLSVVTFMTASAEISVGTLQADKAKDTYGITMHAAANGDAGVKVWLEFKRKGRLEKFTYAEFQLLDEEGNHLVSAKLHPNPIHHRQKPDITSVAFSVAPSQLKNCRFLVVCYNSNEGDVGYYLHARDFLDMQNPTAADSK